LSHGTLIEQPSPEVCSGIIFNCLAGGWELARTGYTVSPGIRGCSVLLNGAGYRGESIIGIRADETNSANDQDQDHGQHHCVFCDILPALVSQNLGEDTHFSAIPFNRENSDFRLVMPTLQKDERAAASGQPNSEPDSTERLCSGAPAVSIGKVFLRNQLWERHPADFNIGGGFRE